MKPFLPLLVLATAAHGFQAGLPLIARKTTSLHSFLHLSTTTEEDAAYLIAKAQECALSDDVGYSKDDIRFFLRELIHVQSSCVIGTLAGQYLCQNQDLIKDIVVHLQGKLHVLENESGNAMNPVGFSVGKDGTAVLNSRNSRRAVELAVTAVIAAFVVSSI